MAGGPSIRLYRAEWSTNCERVGLALAHKGVAAQSVVIEYSNRGPVEAVSGQGLVPVIEDAGKVVNDSVAILRYLEELHPEPPLFPTDPERRTAVERAEAWGDEVLQPVPRRLAWAALSRDRSGVRSLFLVVEGQGSLLVEVPGQAADYGIDVSVSSRVRLESIPPGDDSEREGGFVVQQLERLRRHEPGDEPAGAVKLDTG